MPQTRLLNENRSRSKSPMVLFPHVLRSSPNPIILVRLWKRKTWAYTDARSALEAFALPIVVERATQKPTLIGIATNCTHRSETHKRSYPVLTQQLDIHRCFVLTTIEKVRSFQKPRTKRQVNAFHNMSLLLSNPPIPLLSCDFGASVWTPHLPMISATWTASFIFQHRELLANID